MATAVFADNLEDSLAAGSVSNPTIAEGGSLSVTINYQVQKTGANNTTFPATVAFALSSSAPSWAVVSPTSRTFSGYSDVQSVMVSGTAPTGSAGTYTFDVVPTTLAPNLNAVPGKTTLTVTVEESNADPVLTLPTSLTVEGNTLGGANVTYTGISASDTEDGDLTTAVVCTPTSGSFFALGGPVTVSCSVEDSAGATDSGSFTVTVIDTTGPVVTGPTDAQIEGNTAGGATQTSGLASLGSATATDTVWGDVTASITNDAPTTFSLSPPGPTTVTYTALDGSGNSGTTSAILTVVDTTDPTIGTHANITTTTMNAGGKVVTYTAPTATDIVDTFVDVNCVPASGSTFAIGTTTVTCTATDDSGNTAESQFTVTVSLLTVLWKEPVNGPSVVNVAKAGRVIPVKVEVFVDGTENANTGTVSFKLWKSNSCSTAAQDAVETFAAVGEAAGGSNYVWNADGGFYQYNLKTPTTAGCYRGEAYLDGELAGYFLINATK